MLGRRRMQLGGKLCKAPMVTVPVLIILLFTFSFSTQVSACSCVELPSVDESVESSTAVFSGKAVDIKEEKKTGANVVLFEVSETWKGVNESQVFITTGSDSANCGIHFEMGKEYLVYASKSTMYGEESLVSIICDRTNLLSAADEDRSVLGEGKPPTEEVDLTNEVSGNSLYLWSVGLLLGASAVIVIYFFVKKRKVH